MTKIFTSRRTLLQLEPLEDRFCLSGGHCGPDDIAAPTDRGDRREHHDSRDRPRQGRRSSVEAEPEPVQVQPRSAQPVQERPPLPSVVQVRPRLEAPASPRPSVVSPSSQTDEPKDVRADAPVSPPRMMLDMASAKRTEENSDSDARNVGRDALPVVEESTRWLTAFPATSQERRVLQSDDSNRLHTIPTANDPDDGSRPEAKHDSDAVDGLGSAYPRLPAFEPRESDLIPLELDAVTPIFADLWTDVGIDSLPPVEQALDSFFGVMERLAEPTEGSERWSTWYYAAPTVFFGATAVGYLAARRRRQTSPSNAVAESWPRDEPLM